MLGLRNSYGLFIPAFRLKISCKPLSVKCSLLLIIFTAFLNDSKSRRFCVIKGYFSKCGITLSINWGIETTFNVTSDDLWEILPMGRPAASEKKCLNFLIKAKSLMCKCIEKWAIIFVEGFLIIWRWKDDYASENPVTYQGWRELLVSCKVTIVLDWELSTQ